MDNSVLRGFCQKIIAEGSRTCAKSLYYDLEAKWWLDNETGSNYHISENGEPHFIETTGSLSPNQIEFITESEAYEIYLKKKGWSTAFASDNRTYTIRLIEILREDPFTIASILKEASKDA